MTAMQISGREVHFNQKGHLASFTDWDDDLARALAADEGLSLTDCHWTVIQFLREYYAFIRSHRRPKL